MKYIPLTQNKTAAVDDDDFDFLVRWKWRAQKDYKNGNWYAVAYINGRDTLMHRLLMGFPKKLQVDHVDRDGLNNKRHNLRVATHGQNHSNTTQYKSNKSGYKGVSKSKKEKKYRAQIKVDGKVVYLGQFSNARDAAEAYNLAAQNTQGEFAYQNAL